MKRLITGSSIPTRNKIIQLDDIMNHKKYVLDACYKMAKYFIEIEEDDLALEIMKKAFLHDISKLSKKEFYGYALNAENWGKGDKPLETQEAISSHYNDNPHHPEYWDNIDNMSTIAVIEMCCDWYARGLQFGTDFWEYYIDILKPKFNFSDKIEEIIKACYDILSK